MAMCVVCAWLYLPPALRRNVVQETAGQHTWSDDLRFP